LSVLSDKSIKLKLRMTMLLVAGQYRLVDFA